jgi:thiamine biosynthesis lipoprotein
MHNKPTPVTKRIGTAAVLSKILLTLAVVTACSSPPARQTETELLLGTTINVTTYGDAPQRVFDRIFSRVLEIEQRMSTSEDDYDTTEIMRVNDAAGREAVRVSDDTFQVVREAIRYSEMTDGAFDVSVGPLVTLWGIGTEWAAVPEEEQIDAALAAIDYRDVTLDPATRSIYLENPGMGIDVGGIAKGFAADEAERILRDEGIESALLDFGGNILTLGTKPDGSAWRIGVQVPDASRGAYLGIAEVVDRTVVTSGTYERYFEEDGIRYHHILDTDTGYPVRNELDSVTIITQGSTKADALSTAIFAMGLENGRTFVENLPDAEALFVTADKRVHMTSGMDDYFELTNEEFALAE